MNRHEICQYMVSDILTNSSTYQEALHFVRKVAVAQACYPPSENSNRMPFGLCVREALKTFLSIASRGLCDMPFVYRTTSAPSQLIMINHNQTYKHHDLRHLNVAYYIRSLNALYIFPCNRIPEELIARKDAITSFKKTIYARYLKHHPEYRVPLPDIATFKREYDHIRPVNPYDAVLRNV